MEFGLSASHQLSSWWEGGCEFLEIVRETSVGLAGGLWVLPLLLEGEAEHSCHRREKRRGRQVKLFFFHRYPNIGAEWLTSEAEVGQRGNLVRGEGHVWGYG